MADEEVEPRERRLDGRMLTGIVLGVVLGALIVQNTDETRVNWLFWDIEAPLWVVLAGTAALTLVIGELVGATLRRRKRKAAAAR